MITLPTLQTSLEQHEPARLEPPETIRQRASVALVFAGPAERLHLCFICRAERPGDRWSGQIAFPGGRADATDPTPRHVAMRETREEVGLELAHAAHLGDLSELPLHRHGDSRGGVLSPSVFYLGDDLLTLHPEPGEVAEAFWIPTTHLYNTSNQTSWRWDSSPYGPMDFPGIAFREHVIWGLTWRVLFDLSSLLALRLPGAG